MKCPTDGSTLAIADRQGIEIDYCPECRGIWLDRGELDKLIERSATNSDSYKGSAIVQMNHHAEDKQSQSQTQRPHKKRESFLGDLFDF